MMTSEPLDHHPDAERGPPPRRPVASSSSLPAPLARLMASRLGRLVRFGIVGGSGVLVNLVVFQVAFALLATAPLAPTVRHTLANVLGVLVSIFTNFLLNDTWTWGDRLKGGRRDWLHRLGRYYATCSIAGVIQVGCASAVFALLRRTLGEWTILGVEIVPELAVLVGIVCGIAVNFPISHLWAFKDADVTEDAPSHPH